MAVLNIHECKRFKKGGYRLIACLPSYDTHRCAPGMTERQKKERKLEFNHTCLRYIFAGIKRLNVPRWMRFPDNMYYLVCVRLGLVIADGPQRDDFSCRKGKACWLCKAEQDDLDDHVGPFEQRDFAAMDREKKRAAAAACEMGVRTPLLLMACRPDLLQHKPACAGHNGTGRMGLNLFSLTTSAHSPVGSLLCILSHEICPVA